MQSRRVTLIAITLILAVTLLVSGTLMPRKGNAIVRTSSSGLAYRTVRGLPVVFFKSSLNNGCDEQDAATGVCDPMVGHEYSQLMPGAFMIDVGFCLLVAPALACVWQLAKQAGSTVV